MANTLQPLLWGFNFLFGTIFALLLKAVLNGLKQKGIIKRAYTSNFIAGFMFDIMVTASIAAIPLSACQYREFIVPLILICVLGAVAIYYYLEFLTKRIFFDYPHEAFLSLYGMLTGTANTGAVLLHYNTVDIEQSLLLDAVYIHDGEILPAHITIFVYTLNVITVLTILLKQHFASAADETGGKPEVYAW